MPAVTEIVIVPAWRRPAFLLATLRRLEIATDGDPGIQIWISLDRRHDQATARVANVFQRTQPPGRVALFQKRHPYRGNSYNVLHSYRVATLESPTLVHLVEEDVFVGADYFAFHRSAHRLAPDAFAVSAARNQNHIGDPDPDPGALYLGPQYQSLAVSFRPERLAPVLAHAVSAYFSDPIGYCRRHFRRSRIPAANAEQDGLINRVVEQAGARVAYPALPRAYHAGFVGYHRKGETLTGSVAEQADQLLAMDTARMNAAAHSYPDHQAVDLDARPGPVNRLISWP
jgi:hypothetical protein